MNADATTKLLLAAILAALIGIGAFLFIQAQDDKWSDEQCLKASLRGPSYDPAGMREHGCFD